MSYNSKYLASSTGHIYKIKEMGLTQTNNFIANRKRVLRRSVSELTVLYERRAILLEKPIEKGKAKRKVAELLKVESKPSKSSQRMQQIILLALTQLNEEDPDLSIVTAILEQAKELEV